jgi:hypothetical protein
MKFNSQTNTMLNGKIEKNNIKNNNKKKIRVNLT